MPEIRFSGASDDLVEVDGLCSSYTGDGKLVNGEEYNLLSSTAYIGVFRVSVSSDPDSPAMLVHAVYGHGGTWAFAPALSGEDAQFPAWPLRFEVGERAYSLDLIIDAPEGAFVELVGRK